MVKRAEPETDGAFFVRRYFKNARRYVIEVFGVKLIEDWQGKVLDDLSRGETRIAVKSGHGIGKTALISWIVHWFIATRPNPQIVVTANTEPQLRTKTWRELSKWNQRAKNAAWFVWTATKFYLKSAAETWFASAIPWNENRPESFAGTHEEHVLFVFDEGSGIPNIIYETAEGAMTTTGAIFVTFGNPTRKDGRFFELFGKFKHRWKNYTVDSRTVSFTDKKKIQEWIEDYGEDSDFVRVRVKGEFPRAAYAQFISQEHVDHCHKYKAGNVVQFPKILGCDIARFGDDQNVVACRQGRKVWPLKKWRGMDTMFTASRIAEIITQSNPDIVFIDGDGVGGGVVDRLKQLVDPSLIFEVNWGLPADDPKIYFNQRAEWWGRLRSAMQAGLEFPHDPELDTALTGPMYGFSDKNQIQLERKKDMKARGLASPDEADSIAFTYAVTNVRIREKGADKRRSSDYGLDKMFEDEDPSEKRGSGFA